VSVTVTLAAGAAAVSVTISFQAKAVPTVAVEPPGVDLANASTGKTGLTGTDIGITYLLPRLIGAARAFDMILTGRTVDAVEAERIGIVSRVVPDDDLWAETLSLASGVAGYTAHGLRNTKEVMWHNLDTNNMAAAIALENRNQDLANQNEEVRSFMQAYMAPIRRT